MIRSNRIAITADTRYLLITTRPKASIQVGERTNSFERTAAPRVLNMPHRRAAEPLHLHRHRAASAASLCCRVGPRRGTRRNPSPSITYCCPLGDWELPGLAVAAVAPGRPLARYCGAAALRHCSICIATCVRPPLLAPLPREEEKTPSFSRTPFAAARRRARKF